jgi:hypothetical protein
VMHYDAGCNCTQGILFGDYLKEVITGQNLPGDLASEAESSPLSHQYDPDSSKYLARPDQLRTSDLTFAFERG